MTPIDLFLARLTIADVASNDYDHAAERLEAIARDLREAGAVTMADEVSHFGFVAFRAALAEHLDPVPRMTGS